MISYGSGYGGNAFTWEKCFALRIASVMGREEVGCEQHANSGVENPQGEKIMWLWQLSPVLVVKPILPCSSPLMHSTTGKSSTVGDDIAWIHKTKKANHTPSIRKRVISELLQAPVIKPIPMQWKPSKQIPFLPM